MVVLVTGAAGRIGSAMVELLRSLKVERRCLDLAPSRRPVEEPWKLCDLAELSDPEGLRAFCRPVTHVIHLASRVTNSKDFAATFPSQFRIEVLGTLNLLRALPSSARHVAYASSMTVYGAPEHLPVGEDHPLRPSCVYALCKVVTEQHLAAFLELPLPRVDRGDAGNHVHAGREPPLDQAPRDAAGLAHGRASHQHDDLIRHGFPPRSPLLARPPARFTVHFDC